jgi:hypothetical protein
MEEYMTAWSHDFREVCWDIMSKQATLIIPPYGLGGFMDDLLWFNQNRHSGDRQDGIRSECERIAAALGVADSGDGIAMGSELFQNAARLLKPIHPAGIDGVFLNYRMITNPEAHIGATPDRAKLIWSVLAYCDGFVCLVPAALGGSQGDLREAKRHFEVSLLYRPQEECLQEAIHTVEEISAALERHDRRRRGLWGRIFG